MKKNKTKDTKDPKIGDLIFFDGEGFAYKPHIILVSDVRPRDNIGYLLSGLLIWDLDKSTRNNKNLIKYECRFDDKDWEIIR